MTLPVSVFVVTHSLKSLCTLITGLLLSGSPLLADGSFAASSGMLVPTPEGVVEALRDAPTLPPSSSSGMDRWESLLSRPESKVSDLSTSESVSGPLWTIICEKQMNRQIDY